MKIIVAVHDSVAPVRGGGALRTIKTAAELKKRGHEVLVIAPSEKSDIGGIPVGRLFFVEKGKTGFAALALFAVSFLVKLLSAKFRGRADVVFAHNAVLGFPTAIARALFDFRFVFDVTDLHAEYIKYERRGLFMSLALPFILWAEYFAARRADKVVTVTETMKSMLTARGVRQEKIDVVYDGVDAADFAAYGKKAGFEYNIIHIGSMEETDGVMNFVAAMPAVAREHPTAGFIFVGGGRDYAAVVEKIRAAGLGAKCVFTGWVDYEKVRERMAEAAVGVITRPLTPPNHAVITLKLLEYWASGTAVVSTRLKGIEEVADENRDVVYYDAVSSDDLAEKLNRLLSEPSRRARIAAAGREKSARFAWPPLIGKIADATEMK